VPHAGGIEYEAKSDTFGGINIGVFRGLQQVYPGFGLYAVDFRLLTRVKIGEYS
jgi:hypothetical protein